VTPEKRKEAGGGERIGKRNPSSAVQRTGIPYKESKVQFAAGGYKTGLRDVRNKT